MPITNSSIRPNFATLPDELEEVIGQDPIIINDSIMDGFGKIREDFRVEQTDDKTPIFNLEVMDVNQPAKDDFNPTPDAVKIGAKLPKFHDIDIDLVLKRSDLLKIFRSYERWVATPGRTKEEVLANPWEMFFAKKVLEKAGEGLALKGTYRGVYNELGFGSMSSIDGLFLKFAAGRGSGGDIPSSHVYNSTVTNITATNAYQEVLEVAQKTEVEPGLVGTPLIMRLSPNVYRLYNKNRRALFPEFVGPNDQAKTVDDFENITIVPDLAYGNSEHISITVAENLLFLTNEDLGNYNMKMIEGIKHWELNIHYSACVEYGWGKLIFSNNRV
jgi:hypothetical protein